METRTYSCSRPARDPSYLIPILQDIQEHYGYLPEDEMRQVALHTCLPVSRVYGVATFYNQFRFRPLGKYVVRVCRGTACHVKGSLDILRTLENELGIKAGETTKDLAFSIETVACIGACSIAPVIAVNEEFHGGLTLKSLQKLIKSYTAKAKAQS
jgi:NADH-quinone oxidoreductase subunit E